jgi:hypothetical protein
VCENGEHSFFEVSNTRQFEKNTPVDEPQHEVLFYELGDPKESV